MSSLKQKFETIWHNSWWISFFIFIVFFTIPFTLIHKFIKFSFASAPLTLLISTLVANFSVLFFQNFRRWHLFGITPNKSSFKHFLFGFFLPMFLFFPLLIFLTFEGISFNALSSEDVFFYLYYIGFSATYEELIFRGVLFQRLIEKKGEIFAVAVSSLVFSLGHLWNPHFSILSFFNIFLAGVFLGICFVKTQMLWLSIGYHFGWNFWQKLILDSPVSGLKWGKPLIQTKISQLNEFVFGGDFGIEGGILCTILLLISIVIVSKFFVPVPEIASRIFKERYCREID